MARIFTDLVKHNYRSNQSAFMTRFGTDLCHQYGIFGGKSQTSFSRNATRPGSEEGWLFLQANLKPHFQLLIICMEQATSSYTYLSTDTTQFPILQLWRERGHM